MDVLVVCVCAWTSVSITILLAGVQNLLSKDDNNSSIILDSSSSYRVGTFTLLLFQFRC